MNYFISQLFTLGYKASFINSVEGLFSSLEKTVEPI